MINIMFVCHGNICRSPTAEFVFRELVKEAGLSSRISVSSSATSTEELGSPVYPRAKDELIAHGISPKGKYAVLLSRSDYSKYDMFVGMDGANIRNMHRIFGSDPDGKISRLMDYTERGGDVSDPWYSRRFDIAYRDISEGCRALLDHIVQKEGLHAKK